MTFLDIYQKPVDLRTVTRLYVDRRVRQKGPGEWCVFAQTEDWDTRIMAQFDGSGRGQLQAGKQLRTLQGPWKLARRYQPKKEQS